MDDTECMHCGRFRYMKVVNEMYSLCLKIIVIVDFLSCGSQFILLKN
jgi:hypothetical protein